MILAEFHDRMIISPTCSGVPSSDSINKAKGGNEVVLGAFDRSVPGCSFGFVISVQRMMYEHPGKEVGEKLAISYDGIIASNLESCGNVASPSIESTTLSPSNS